MTRLAKRLVASLMGVLLPLTAQAAQPVPAAPQLNSAAYILIDAASGDVLVEKNPDQRLPPASLTKLMTSYVASHEIHSGNIKMDDIVTVSLNAWSAKLKDSSLMFIEVGKQVRVEDLLKGIIIVSGNDASVALAEHIAGTEQVFADMMNQHAKRLGMNNTHFVNSHGLPDPNHFTTARDLAILARHEVNDYPQYYSFYSQHEFTFNNIKQRNRNGLLFREGAGVDGLKTGHTAEAGYCLVASAQRDGMRLISVVLGAPSWAEREAQSLALLNYGFRFYQTQKVGTANEVLTTARVWKGAADQVQIGVMQDMHATLPRKKAEEIKRELKIPSVIEAPIAQGQPLGTLEISLDGKVLQSHPVVALQAVEAAGFFGRLWDGVVMFFMKLFGQLPG